jgi:flagellar FliL protein
LLASALLCRKATQWFSPGHQSSLRQACKEAVVAEEKAAAPAESSDAKGGGGKPIILYALVVLNMLVVAGVGFMLYSAKKKEAEQPTLDKVIQGEHQAQAEEHHEEQDFVGKMIPMETFLVNLSGNRGNKLLKVNMELEVEGEKVMEEIDKRKPQIRDIIIILLSSKTYAQLSSTEGKEFLREEIRDTVNSFLTKGKIKRVHFTEFIFN